MTTNSKNPDSKVHGANMGPIWGQQDPGWPHDGPMNFVIWEISVQNIYINVLTEVPYLNIMILIYSITQSNTILKMAHINFSVTSGVHIYSVLYQQYIHSNVTTFSHLQK